MRVIFLVGFALVVILARMIDGVGAAFPLPNDLVILTADNALLTISMITMEALRVLKNNLTFTRRVNRQYDSKFGVAGAKIGTVLNVRKPPRYLGRTGQALSLEDAVETSVPVTLDTQAGVDLAFTSEDLALSIDQFSDRFVKPAIASIANRVDADGLSLFDQIYQSVGTPGTVPNTLLTYLSAGVALDDSATPMDGQRSIVISPLMQATIVNALTGLFHQGSEIARQYTKGTMGNAAGFEWFMDQNIATHTVGPLGGTPLVDGADQTGASLVTDGWTAAAALRLNRGDNFTIAGVNSVNPQSRQDTGTLQRFVVTADSDSTAGGAVTIPIDPPITPSGAFQTVSASPADDAALTIIGAANTVTRQGLAFHQDAFTLCVADLPIPDGIDMGARASDDDLGLSIRLIRDYDINLDRWPCRLDLLFGWAVLRPELAARIHS
jgi:hypothetical protein